MCRGYLEGGLRRVRKNDVVYTLQNGCWINILGIISTLLGLQVLHSPLCAGSQTRWLGVLLLPSRCSRLSVEG